MPGNPKRHVGHLFASGPQDAIVKVEVFVDVHCPFCLKIMPRLIEVAAAFPQTVRMVVIPFGQPWHTTVVTALRGAYIGAVQLPEDKSLEWLLAVMKDREWWVDTEAQLERTLGDQRTRMIELGKKFELPEDEFAAGFADSAVTQEIKFAAKYQRQNGIHVSPTVMINGLIDNGVSSSWELEQWRELLDPLVSLD